MTNVTQACETGTRRKRPIMRERVNMWMEVKKLGANEELALKYEKTNC